MDDKKNPPHKPNIPNDAYQAATIATRLIHRANDLAESLNQDIAIMMTTAKDLGYDMAEVYTWDTQTFLPKRGTGLVEREDGHHQTSVYTTELDASGRTDVVPATADLVWLTDRAIMANALVKKAEQQYLAGADLRDTLVTLRQKTETLSFALRTWTGKQNGNNGGTGG